MAKERTNGHSKTCVKDEESSTSLSDARFCPPLLKLMIPHVRGVTRKYKKPDRVADGAD